MKLTTTITITLLMLAMSNMVLTNPVCNTDALAKLITSPNAQNKENEEEGDFVAFTPASTPSAVAEADSSKICYNIWKDANGTCCAHDDIQARADKLVEKLKKRLRQRYKVVKNGKDKVLDQITKIEERLNKNKDKLKAKGGKAAKVDEWIATLAKLKQNQAKDEEIAKKAIEGMKTCIKAVVETRVKVWCMSCAAVDTTATLDTTNFFTGDKLNVKKAVCESMIDKCADVFAYFRKVRACDRVARNFYKAATGKDKNGASSDIEANTDADLEADQTCVGDLSTCKADNGIRQSFCARFKLNKDDPKTWGDGKILETEPADLPEDARRILAASSSDGDATESATGADYTTLNANYQVDASEFEDFAKILASLSMAFAIFTFMF